MVNGSVPGGDLCSSGGLLLSRMVGGARMPDNREKVVVAVLGRSTA
jgi:hypothetical protein